MISRRSFFTGSAALLVGAAVESSVRRTRAAGLVECIFVVIVLIIAGFVIYKIIKLCKTYLGSTPPTNPPPPVTNAMSAVTVPDGCVKLPPIAHLSTIGSRVVFQSSSDMNAWTDRLSYSITEPDSSSLQVTVFQGDTQVAQKTVPIVASPDGGVATVDLTAETAEMFPKTDSPAGNFRLLSTNQ